VKFAARREEMMSCLMFPEAPITKTFLISCDISARQQMKTRKALLM
jgi:hypothetical protein